VGAAARAEAEDEADRLAGVVGLRRGGSWQHRTYECSDQQRRQAHGRSSTSFVHAAYKGVDARDKREHDE
jgi:hypothetical protein